MSQPQCIISQRKTLQNAAGAEASENTIGGLSGERQEEFHHHSSSWKPQAPPPTKPHPTLLFQPHAALQTTTIQPLSMQTKLQTQPPLSSFNPLPPPTACLLGAHVYILLPNKPPSALPMCPAQTSSKAVYGHLSPKAPSSSPTLVPIITNLQLFLFIHERHPPPPNWYCNLWWQWFSSNCRKHTDTIAVCPYSHQMYLSIGRLQQMIVQLVVWGSGRFDSNSYFLFI